MWMRSLLGRVILVVGFFSFHHFIRVCHSLQDWRVFIERSAFILIGIPLYVIYCFSLAAFNIFSLCLIFLSLINICLGLFHLGFILFGIVCVSCTWVAISFPILGKFSTITSSSIFSCLFFLSASSGTPMIQILTKFNIVPEISEVFPISFNSFLCFSSLLHLFPPFYLPPHSASVILLLFPTKVLLISYYIVHFWLTLLYFFYVLVKHFLHFLNPCL